MVRMAQLIEMKRVRAKDIFGGMNRMKGKRSFTAETQRAQRKATARSCSAGAERKGKEDG